MELYMSFSQLWKLALASFCAISLAACAGSRQGGDSNYEDSEYSEDGAAAAPGKAQQVDEDELKKTQEEAFKATEENHELRRQIFEAKTKLGISTQTQEEAAPAEESSAEETPAEAQ